jgi:penicillin-binding protein 1A
METREDITPEESTYYVRRKSAVFLVSLAAFLILILLLFLELLNTYNKGLPSFSQLTNIEPSLSTKIYSADGNLIKEFYTQRRILVPLKQMPPYLVNALLASEDRKFYSHWGIDLTGTARALTTALLRLRNIQGASTITQQLARTLFLTMDKTMSRKIKEALTAIKLERTYSKDEILEMYLNQIYFGQGAYGVQAAAQVFFSKDAKELSLPECALLVGVLPSPNRYSPFKDPDLALSRRNSVMKAMKDFGKLTKAEYDSLKALPLQLKPSSLRMGSAPYFTEMVRRYLEKKYGEKDLYSSGLVVYTTLNFKLQEEAEKIMLEQLEVLQKEMEKTHSLDDSNYTVEVVDSLAPAKDKSIRRAYKQMQGSLVAIDNNTGDILAMVGGKDFEKSKFNRAIQAQRQPGSAFKPFVFTAAIDNGYKVTDIIYDTPIVLIAGDGKEWRPENFDKTFKGPMNLREALRISRNLVSIKLLQKIGPEQAVFYASKMGIKSPLQAIPSLAIGTSEVNLLELTSAFSVFPNGGIRVEPRYIAKIVDRYGNTLEESSSPQKEEVLSVQTSCIMTSLLQTVVDRGTGAAARAMGFSRPAGGKTGTTDECMDNWFVGFTPQITTGVWVGYDDKTVIGKDVTGATTALPIWTNFMLKAHEGLPVENFQEPTGIVHKIVCTESGLLATDKCPSIVEEIFVQGNEPEKTCDIHPSKNPPSPDKIKSRTEQKKKEELHF